MTVSFRCPSCHTTFRVEDSSLGKAVICPNPGCNRKAVLPKVGGTQSNATTSSRKKPGGTKAAMQSRQQRFAKAAEPVVEKLNPSSLVAAPQQPINKSAISREVLLIAGIGGAAVILIAVLGLVLVLRQSPNEQGTLVAATDVAATDQTTSEAKIGDALQPQDSPIKSAAQTPASATVSTQPQSLTVEEVASKTEASIAFIEGDTGSGTGFLIEPHILATNRHVINEELIEQIKIHFPSAPAGEQGPFTAKLIYKDPDKDLAFLKVETSLPPLTTPAQHSFRRGQDVIVIGNPGIGNQVLKNAVSQGVVGTEYTSETDGQDYYQLSISINSGNSGGPVLDRSGNILGVITLKARQQEGVAFCVPLPQLTEAWEKGKSLTEAEIAVMRSEHRLGVVVHTVSTTGARYEIGMQIYLDSMKEAMKSGRTAQSGLDIVRDEVTQALQGQDRWLVDADLSREASRVSSDPNIPDRIREQFAELWTNYKEMKSNVENPRGTFETFHTKFLQLSDTHERLMHALNLHLGVKDD